MREYTNATAVAALAAAERDPQPEPVRFRAPRYTWVHRAACRTLTPHRRPGEEEVDDPFYPGESLFYPPPVADRACFSCPVRLECLEVGLANRESGVWGGLTEKQRKALKRPRVRLSCPVCGSDLMITVGGFAVLQVCTACGNSWSVEKRSKSGRRVT